MIEYKAQFKAKVLRKHLYVMGDPGDHYSDLCVGDAYNNINDSLNAGFILPIALYVKSVLQTSGGNGYKDQEAVLGEKVECKICSLLSNAFMECSKTKEAICIPCTAVSTCYITGEYMLSDYLNKCNKCECLASIGNHNKIAPYFFTCSQCS